jgi:hypothetical protein
MVLYTYRQVSSNGPTTNNKLQEMKIFFTMLERPNLQESSSKIFKISIPRRGTVRTVEIYLNNLKFLQKSMSLN